VANWPRVVLSLTATRRGEFVLHAAKRRPPWRAPDKSQAYEIGLAHSHEGLWIDRDISQAEAAGSAPPVPLETYFPHIIKIVKEREEVAKTLLYSLLYDVGDISRDRARDAVNACLDEKPPRVTLRKRKGKGGGYVVTPAEDQRNLKEITE